MYITMSNTVSANALCTERSGAGEYTGKAYMAETKVIYTCAHIALREVVRNAQTSYEILWDGDILSRLSNIKEAIALVADFVGTTPNKVKKAIAAAAA